MRRELAPLDQPLAPAKLAHFVLRTRALKQLVEWYQSVLGAHVVFENPVIAFMTFDDEHHRLALIQNPQWTDAAPDAVGLEHIAFTMGDLGRLLHTYKRLDGQGIHPYWCVNHGPTTSMYFRDPEANQVELQVDNFESVEVLQAWFRGDAFAKNPVGTTFDPAKLLERWEAGHPLEELAKQGSA